jgi:hypothetical protein
MAGSSAVRDNDHAVAENKAEHDLAVCIRWENQWPMGDLRAANLWR